MRKNETRNSEIDRRQLLKGTLSLAGMGPLCCTTPELPQATVTYRGQTLLIDLSQAADLHQTGAARVVVDPTRKLNIIVANTGRNHFVALDRPALTAEPNARTITVATRCNAPA